MKVKDFIKRLETLNQDTEIVDMYWTEEDVTCQAKNDGIDLSDDEVVNIIGLLSSEHDANIGINWDQISYQTQMVTGGTR
jgi:hypothetical protein